MHENKFALPMELSGRKLRYSGEKNHSYLLLPPLGFVLAIGLYLQQGEKKREEKKKRDRQLMLDYSELVSKLNVYLGAGLTVRNAFLEISRHYDRMVEESAVEDRYLYKELRRIPRKLKENIPESEVYQSFSQNIALRPYTKLVSLIEQNRKNGSRDLRAMLDVEMADAFEIRKAAARRLGEESSTKLLLPMLIQLCIVMLMIVVPAFASFY